MAQSVKILENGCKNSEDFLKSKFYLQNIFRFLNSFLRKQRFLKIILRYFLVGKGIKFAGKRLLNKKLKHFLREFPGNFAAGHFP